MNIITEPHVHLLAAPRFFPHPEYELPPVGIEHSGVARDAHQIIAHAGKGCYDSYGADGRSISEHIANLRNTRHGSVFEHVHISLFLSGISRGLSHEFVRHRHFNYSQRSTRYTKEDGASIVLDPYFASLSPADGLRLAFIDSCEKALGDYVWHVTQLMETPEAKAIENKTERRKWARGKARQLLPHALETRMTVTGNIRSWRWFLEERSAEAAEPEIRRLSNAIFDVIAPVAPLAFEDYITGPSAVVNGYMEFKTKTPKI